MKFFLKRVPLYFIFLFTIIGALFSFLLFSFTNKNAVVLNGNASLQPVYSNSCGFEIKRLAGRKFIKPLLLAERSCEDESFNSIKTSLAGLINNLKSSNDISDASVYIRVFQRGLWASLNDEIKYQPGSLFKVPLLMTYLRISEEKPGFLNTRITFNTITDEAKGLKQEFLKRTIKIGGTYTYRELFTYMICHSDNNATMLLMNSIPFSEFQKTFTDMGLSSDLTKNDAVISAKDYSSFWIALYNGSYLNFDDSEYALSLLSQSDFTEGMMKGIPDNVKVSHKFGEKGDANNHAFSEAGIVYANNTPYLISIMTQGKNQDKLPKAIQQISALVFNNIQSLTQ